MDTMWKVCDDLIGVIARRIDCFKSIFVTGRIPIEESSYLETQIRSKPDRKQPSSNNIIRFLTVAAISAKTGDWFANARSWRFENVGNSFSGSSRSLRNQNQVKHTKPQYYIIESSAQSMERLFGLKRWFRASRKGGFKTALELTANKPAYVCATSGHQR